jgi:biopolymer transport protein TolR
MAMSAAAAGSKGGRRRRGGRRHRPMSEINMTPFIDVMLVLLIIFMVAAPLLTVGVPLDLPQTKAAALNIDKQPLTISVRSDGKVYLMETPISVQELIPKLEAMGKAKDERIFVRADRAANYGQYAEVLSAVSTAGYTRLAVVTEPLAK